ncbi:MAG: hypothetical protein H0U80_02200, partial [Solirubrobacterales bacterium]|nr:hypothetical protein [Solirubrobacterales bacterium]
MRPEELATAITGLHAWALENAPVAEGELPRRLREHLGVTPSGLEVLTEELSSYDQVNVQVALDAMSAEGGLDLEVIGLSLEHGFRPGLAEISQGSNAYGSMLEPGPVEYASIDVGDRTISCVQAGLLLIREGDDRLAVLLAPPEEDQGLSVEAMATRR